MAPLKNRPPTKDRRRIAQSFSGFYLWSRRGDEQGERLMSDVDLGAGRDWAPRGRPLSSPPETPVRPRYDGSRWRLFLIAFGRMLLTVLTLGIGRFWMTTRLRRFYWSSVRVGGQPLEYTGNAGELFIGFLMAVVIIATYLAVVNLGLTFVGLSFLQGNPFALQLPLLALIPLGFWAQYRARRYILARTRWRGIRFGLTPGAWGYMWLSLFWWTLTILTLGLLYPVLQLKQSRYATDRSFYGDLAFRQIGGWRPLMWSWLWFWAPIPLLFLLASIMAGLVGGGFGAIIESVTGEGGEDPFAVAAGLLSGGAIVLLFYVWLILAFIRHQVFSFRYLHSRKVLGGETRFSVTLSTTTVIAIYLLGGLAIGIGVGIAAALFLGVGFGFVSALGFDAAAMEKIAAGEVPDIRGAIGAFVVALTYLPAVALYVALSHAFISHPLLRAAMRSTEIIGLEAASRARQRPHDEQREAGGFADALGADIGGAF